MKTPDFLPAPILDMVAKLNDKKINVYTRANYRATLKTIVEYCQANIDKFDREYSSQNNKARARQ